MITRWRFGDVAARLLGGRMLPDPPDDWPCWREPEPALPIDEEITRLMKTNREPQLRSRDELEDRGVRCPHYAMRWVIAAAVDEATETAALDQAEMARRWRGHEEAATKAAAEINTLAETLLHKPPMRRLPALEPPEVMAGYKMVLMFRRSGALDCIIDEARQWQRIFQYDRGEAFDVWRLIFVAVIGGAWKVLTGANAARTDPFIEFVEAAYNSISTDSAISWERSVRRAVDMGLDWSRYEKFKK